MENSRGTSIVVRLPDNEEDLVVDAILVSVTRISICIKTIRKGKATFREYEPFPETRDHNEICVVAHRTSENE